MTDDTAADLVLRNAQLYPVDPPVRRAGAVAARDGLICWIGSDADADRFVDARTEVIDLGGRLLLPGFIDSHNHVRLGSDEDSVQLGAARTPSDVRGLVAAWLAEHPHAQWVEGEGLDYHRVPLAADDLHAVLTGRPAVIFDYSGHGLWLDREGMRRLGIAREVDRVPYGVVEKDPYTGEPTGFLSQFATMGLAGPGARALAELIPWAGAQRRYRRLTRSLDAAVAAGITTVVEPQSGVDDLPLYRRAREEGRLRCRLVAAMYHPPGAPRSDLSAFEDARRRFDDDRLRVAPIKLYVDDVIEQHTAALFEPYADAPTTSGGTFEDPADFADLVAELDSRQFQILIHAIGDRGVHVALDALEYARHVNGARDSRHQLVHIELLASADLPRFRDLGVVACMQPRHCAADVGGEPWRVATGKARWPRAWPFRSIAEAGAALAFSSDWNVAEMDPLLGIYSALTRRDLSGGPPFVPEQTVDLRTAIAAYTTGGAYANFCEDHRGSLAAGKAADLIALSDDIFALPPERIKDCRVELTIVDGTVEHRLFT